MRKEKVIVAMSGGVDSSVVTALLLEQGYQVEGATLDLGLSEKAVADAAAVCAQVGIQHHVLRLAEDFKRLVKEPFCRAYLSGLTPNPCVLCNPSLKFPSFLPLMAERDAAYLATGHYVRLCRDESGRTQLYQAVDKTKDQSYFLYMLPQEILRRCLFPLGGMAKTEVRAKARELGLEVAEKSDSQDICFIPEGDYRDFLREQAGDQIQPGEIVDTQGGVIGRHQGLAYYTVGQRKGLGLALGYPAYVTALQPETNRLVIGREEDLVCREAVCDQLAWLAFDTLTEPLTCTVKVRYKTQPKAATLEPRQDGRLLIRFAETERAVTPGQAAVFYAGEQVLGGGRLIEAALT